MIIPNSSVNKAESNAKKNTLKKYIYSFDEGNKNMRDVLGGKGANLSEMTKLGIPVPFGFTITTDVCDYFSTNENSY